MGDFGKGGGGQEVRGLETNVCKMFVGLGEQKGLISQLLVPFKGRLPREGGSLERAAPSRGRTTHRTHLFCTTLQKHELANFYLNRRRNDNRGQIAVYERSILRMKLFWLLTSALTPFCSDKSFSCLVSRETTLLRSRLLTNEMFFFPLYIFSKCIYRISFLFRNMSEFWIELVIRIRNMYNVNHLQSRRPII